jgi:hypothetical protein
VLGAGRWVLGAGCWVLGAERWVLGAGRWALGAEHAEHAEHAERGQCYMAILEARKRGMAHRAWAWGMVHGEWRVDACWLVRVCVRSIQRAMVE